VPFNQDAVDILIEQIGKHPRYCFTYQGNRIAVELCNSAWLAVLSKAGLQIFVFTIYRTHGIHCIYKRERRVMNLKSAEMEI